MSMNEQWQTFKQVFHNAEQKFIPVKKKDLMRRMNHPWLTKVVKKSIQSKIKAYKAAKTSGRPEDWEVFKNQQQMTKKLIKK